MFFMILLSYFLASISLSNGGLNQLCDQITFFDKLQHTAECLMYNDYGCWCGKGGSGTPVDATDRCCRMHDMCYNQVHQLNECNPYLDQYKYQNGTCGGDASSCTSKTCTCDRNLAICLSTSKYEWKYWGHRFWPGNCL